MVQNSTGTRMVSKSRKGVVRKRAVAPYTKDDWIKELPAFERHFYHCAGYYREGVAAQPRTLTDNPKTVIALLNCPHNVTTTYLLDNMKEAAFTSFYEIEREARSVWRKFEGKEYRANLLLPPMFTAQSQHILRFEGLDSSYKQQKEESEIIHLQSQKTHAILRCFYETKGSEASFQESLVTRIVGCASSFTSGHE